MLEAVNIESIHYDEIIVSSLRKSILALADYQESDGNFKYSPDYEKAEMVHWCHGAPGFISLLSAAAKSYKN